MAPSQEDPTAGDAPSSLIVGLRALRRRWPILLVALVLCVGITAVIDLRATKVYTATSTIEIGQTSNLAALIDSNIRQQPDLTPDRDVGNALTLVDSARVASLVRKSLKLPQSVADVQGLVVPGATSDSNLITLDVTDANPVFAARVANAFADQYAAYREDAARQVVADGAKQLQQQIASLEMVVLLG